MKTKKQSFRVMLLYAFHLLLLVFSASLRALAFSPTSVTTSDNVEFFESTCQGRRRRRAEHVTTAGTPALWQLSSDDSLNSSSRQKRIAVIGAGAVGSYYGARLWQAGHEVHFYMRGENYSAAKDNGLTVTSVEGDVRIAPEVIKVYGTTESMASSQQQPFDWLLVALKSWALPAIPDLIHPLLSPTTRVLVVMNGMIEDDLMDLLREKTMQIESNQPLQCCRALYGGMALICCNRIAPAVVDHTYFGLLSAGIASTLSEDPNDDRVAFEDLFADTIVDVAYEDSLLRGRWKKMVWNLPFNGISVAMGGITVDQIVTDAGLRQLAYTIMDETIAAANTELEDVHGAGKFVPLGETERATMMKLSDGTGYAKFANCSLTLSQVDMCSKQNALI